VKVVTHTSEPWWLATVYGPEEAEKSLFLEELEAICDLCDGAWAVIGDFNLILDEADKNNARINRRTIRAFRDTVATLQLLDIHLHGRRYTWSSEREQPTLVRLDRVLASMEWEEQFPACHLQALASDVSDHCPLHLQTNFLLSTTPRFHFELHWPKSPDYQEALQQGWVQQGDIQDPIARLDVMLRHLAAELRSWAARKIGCIREQLIMARAIILKLDRLGDIRTLSDSERALRADLKRKCLGLSSLDRTIARQRARVRYLADGDANTRYFHLLAAGRRRKNAITRLKVTATSHRATTQWNKQSLNTSGESLARQDTWKGQWTSRHWASNSRTLTCWSKRCPKRKPGTQSRHCRLTELTDRMVTQARTTSIPGRSSSMMYWLPSMPRCSGTAGLLAASTGHSLCCYRRRQTPVSRRTTDLSL
jgi:hypothetical protein